MKILKAVIELEAGETLPMNCNECYEWFETVLSQPRCGLATEMILDKDYKTKRSKVCPLVTTSEK